MTAEYDAVHFFVRFLYSAILTRGLDPCNEESKHLLLERQLSFIILKHSFITISLV